MNNNKSHPEHTIMNPKKLYAGLDVHKNSIVVATALSGSSNAEHYRKWSGSNLSIERGLIKVHKKSGNEKTFASSRLERSGRDNNNKLSPLYSSL